MKEDLPLHRKDPGATLDYPFDWSDWLEDQETIVSSAWEVDPNSITVGDDQNNVPAPQVTESATAVWLAGGELGIRYTVTNKVTTSRGRKDERSRIVFVTDR